MDLGLTEQSRTERQLLVLNEATRALTLSLDLSDILDQIIQTIIREFEPAEAGLIMLWDQSAGSFRPAAASGYDWDEIQHFVPRVGESITGAVYQSMQPVLLDQQHVVEMMGNIQPDNLSILERSLGRDPHPISTLAVPVMAKEKCFGVLVLETFQGPIGFHPEDIPFVVRLAGLMAVAVNQFRLEDAADKANQFNELEKMRSEMMATLSHELRLPLTSVKGYTTALMLEGVNWEPEKTRAFLAEINDEVDSMQSMIKAILDSALIDVGQMKLEIQPVRLQHLAREVSVEIQRYSHEHRMLTDFAGDFPIIEADARWIKQVFRNILENAIKYSPDGGLIIIRGEVRSNDVMVRIADQGIGISPEDLIPLFDKYFRVRSTEKLHVSGTGLGLPVARSIIEAHGGRIWAESRLNQGTTIFFTLPLPDDLLAEEDD